MKEEFEIIISKDGRIKITARGFKGNQCQQPLKKIKSMLSPDGTVLEEGRTWEAGLAEEETFESLKISRGSGKEGD
ncbi:MAG: DUF2997 domain-containing protein [Candidatus Dadabacteria bacterium]|nr:DUF2997 domain-containing protein [Candidatus Dadabacteria bacterium]